MTLTAEEAVTLISAIYAESNRRAEAIVLEHAVFGTNELETTRNAALAAVDGLIAVGAVLEEYEK